MSNEITEQDREVYELLNYDEASPQIVPTVPRPRSFTVPVPVVDYGSRVYVMRSGYFIKIGFSLDVEARYRSLLGSSPHDLSLITSFPGTPALERALHGHFSEHRHRDEWFRPEGALAEWISGGCQRFWTEE